MAVRFAGDSSVVVTSAIDSVGVPSSSVIVIVTACGVLFSATPVFPDTPLIDIVAVSFEVAS